MGFGGFEFLPTIPPLSEESKDGKLSCFKNCLKIKWFFKSKYIS